MRYGQRERNHRLALELTDFYRLKTRSEGQARSHENKSDMNGEVVCSSHSVTVFNHNDPLSPDHGDKTITLTEGRCPQLHCQDDGQRQAGDRMSESDIPEKESSHSQRSPCWSEKQPSPPQLYRTQICLRPSAEYPLSLDNSLSHSPLHTNGNGVLRGHQRRAVRLKVTANKSTIRITSQKNSQNRKVTDYYPIRRSSRKSKTELKCEEKRHIDELITKGIEEGMEVQQIDGKGRAVFATRRFQKGEYVVEYHGDLLQINDAKKREAEYAQNPATGCYMYYFQYLSKTYCVDATKESGRLGRLINHSKNGNCQTKLHDIGGVPHLILVASRNIDEGEELLYDYGDRSKASIAAHPWLKH